MKHVLRSACHKLLFLSFLAVLVVAGCAVQYVSRYDEATERSITSIQRQVESLLQDIERSLGTPEAAYENYTDAYKRLHVDAVILHTRAQAIELNQYTIEQSRELIDWLKNLESLHMDDGGIRNGELVVVLRSQAQQIFVAMLKFELAKKRQFDPAMISEE